jgi:hypothetical protein
VSQQVSQSVGQPAELLELLELDELDELLEHSPPALIVAGSVPQLAVDPLTKV